MAEITFRPGSLDDGFTIYAIFERAIGDFARRSGLSDHPPERDLQEAEKNWPVRRSLFEHLIRSADVFLIAEAGGEPIGYARSILRGEVRDLTDFFVLPGYQAAGVGRAMLERVFPREGAAHRAIIATTDTPALVRYLKAGVYARFPIYNFSRVPRSLPVDACLEVTPLDESQMEALNAVDQSVLGYTRAVDHHWWMQDRAGFLYRCQGRIIGYGYSGYDAGPFALLDENLYPAVLSHAESIAYGKFERIHLEVPLINRLAVDYLLNQGYQMSSFTALFMSDSEFGSFSRYIFPAPPFSV
jgi:GNAT superfamily N-acetyltransferase